MAIALPLTNASVFNQIYVDFESATGEINHIYVKNTANNEVSANFTRYQDLEGMFDPQSADIAECIERIDAGTATVHYVLDRVTIDRSTIIDVDTNNHRILRHLLDYDPIYREQQRLAAIAAKDAAEKQSQTFLYYRCSDEPATPIGQLSSPTFEGLFTRLEPAGWCDDESKAILAYIQANQTSTLVIPAIERAVFATEYKPPSANVVGQFEAELFPIHDVLPEMEFCVPVTPKNS